MKPADIVQAQLDAYNAQDLERFLSFYAPDAVLGAYGGDVLAAGLDAIRARHATLFAAHPQNQARLISRIAFGDKVIDHESVERAPGGERFEVAPIYTLKGAVIARVDFVR